MRIILNFSLLFQLLIACTPERPDPKPVKSTELNAQQKELVSKYKTLFSNLCMHINDLVIHEYDQKQRLVKLGELLRNNPDPLLRKTLAFLSKTRPELKHSVLLKIARRATQNVNWDCPKYPTYVERNY